MNAKKWLTSFLSVAMMAMFLVVVGCGNPTPTPAPVVATPVPEPVPVPVPVPEPVPVIEYTLSDYFPLIQEDWWHYDMSQSGEYQYSVDGEIVSLYTWSQDTAQGCSVFVSDIEMFETEEDIEIETSVMQEDCGQGERSSLWTSGDDGMTQYGETMYWDNITYDPPVNYLPDVVLVGTQQSFESTKNHTNGWGSWEESYSGTATVVAEDEVVVEAGTFDALKIVILIENPNQNEEGDGCASTVRTTMWLAEDIGIVKQETRRTQQCVWGDEGYDDLNIMTRELSEYGNGEHDDDDDEYYGGP